MRTLEIIGICCLLVNICMDINALYNVIKLFKCDSCGKINKQIYRGCSCEYCKRKYTNKSYTIRYGFIRWNDSINTRDKNFRFELKYQISHIFIELGICIGFILVIVLDLIINGVNI